MATSDTAGTWTLLTGHGHVLVSIAKNPGARVRDIANDAGLTERATQAIITDLEEAGYITRHRVGRRTEYTIHDDRGFRHQNQEGLQIGPFLDLLVSSSRADDQPAAQPASQVNGLAVMVVDDGSGPDGPNHDQPASAAAQPDAAAD